MKKFIHITAAIGMAIVINTSAVFATGDSFIDTASTAHSSAIQSLAAEGIVSGVGAQLFQPERNITNAEAIQLVTKAFDINLSYMTFIKAPVLSDFFDFGDSEAWYRDALIGAGANGLSIDRSIDPNAAMTREAFYSLLEEAMEMRNDLPMIKISPVTIDDFDAMDISKSGAIQRAITYGILKLDQGMLLPKEALTRGEAAQAVYDALNIQSSMESAANALVGTLSVAKADDSMALTFELKNDSAQTALLTYNSGQRFDVFVYDSYGELIYKWSLDKVFTMMLESVPINAGETLTYQTEWPMTDNDGKRVLHGQYNIVFESAFDVSGKAMAVSDSLFVDVP